MTGRIVWIASYPKSGNTWLRIVYDALRHGGDPDINALGAVDIASSRHRFDTVLGVRSSDLTPEEVELLRPRADEALVEGVRDDLWRKIHDGLFRGPAGELVVSAQATKLALYLVRDPRDIAVSWSHHAELSLEKLVEQLCSPETALAAETRQLLPQLRQRLGSWSDHVRSWTADAPFPVHAIRYEDCIEDPVTAFHGAFHAAGLEASRAEVEDAVARSSLGRLQAQERAGGFRERQSGHSPFFRRGAPGAWRSELPAELARRIVEHHGEAMAAFGYAE